MLGLIARVRSFWRGMRGTSALDDEMREEFRACVVPTRRALRVQPTEALRAD